MPQVMEANTPDLSLVQTRINTGPYQPLPSSPMHQVKANCHNFF